MEYRSDEDRDFIVDDGYKHDEDPIYVPEKEESSDDDKYVVTVIFSELLILKSFPPFSIIKNNWIFLKFLGF